MLRPPDATVGPFRERNSIILRARLLDNASPQAAIPGSALLTATFTLYNETTGAIINSRTRVDIAANIDVNGDLELTLEPDDMVMVGTGETENHRALIEWTWNVDNYASYEVRIRVENLSMVPA